MNNTVSNSQVKEKNDISKEEDTSEEEFSRLLSLGKERGYITYDELNDALPKSKFSSEKIDVAISSINDMGIQLIESEDVESFNQEQDNHANMNPAENQESEEFTQFHNL